MPNIVPKKHEDKKRAFNSECVRLAERAWWLYACNPNQRLYLVGRKSVVAETLSLPTPIWTELSIEQDGGDDTWQSVVPLYIPRSLTMDGMLDWITRHLRREPLWIYAD